MKKSIYCIVQKVLFGILNRQVALSLTEGYSSLLEKNTFSSEYSFSSSSFMRMRCYCASC